MESSTSSLPSTPSVSVSSSDSGCDSGSDQNDQKSNGAPREKSTSSSKVVIKPTKSYDNMNWMHSRAARHVRILCEYLEVQDRLRHERVLCTLLVFGSARCYQRDEWEKQMAMAKKDLAAAAADESQTSREEVMQRVNRLERIEWLCEYWDKTYELSKKIMEWVQTIEARQAIAKILREIPSPVGGSTDEYAAYDADHVENFSFSEPVALCTGGGPGLMQAANKAAYDTPGARSMGMGISLPFELGLNEYVHRELAFEFHYFFTRKFWMLYSALGLIATPGGLGTMDELMEVLTLKQTGKFKRDIPVILLGKKYWKDVLNFDALVKYGTISERDRDQVFYTDDPEEAFQYIKKQILSDKLVLGDSHIHKSNLGESSSSIGRGGGNAYGNVNNHRKKPASSDRCLSPTI